MKNVSSCYWSCKSTIYIKIISLIKYGIDKKYEIIGSCKDKWKPGGSTDITLEIDKILNEKIISFLEQNYDYPIISEESDESPDFFKTTGKYWILDPLDGSMNFYRNIPISCISLLYGRIRSHFWG